MHAVSVNPSVSTLTESRLARHQSDAMVQSGPRPPVRRGEESNSVPRLLVHALRRGLVSATAMRMGQEIATPAGPVRAEIVLQRERRRVALVVQDGPQERDALLMVYGGFDAVYRIPERDATWAAVAVTALLAEAEPELFGNSDGPRLASLFQVRSLTVGRSTLRATGWDGGIVATVHRRRINRPAEWVAAFKQVTAPVAENRRAS